MEVDESLRKDLQELLPRRIQYQKARITDQDNNKKKYKPINRRFSADENGGASPRKKKSSASSKSSDTVGDDYLWSITGKPHTQLFDRSLIDLDWNEKTAIGCGLNNLGNTCFLNSALQCITYTPPLANFLRSRTHSKSCSITGFCLFCIMESHVNNATKRSKNQTITPKGFVANLRTISKHFRRGRQEDSHEFIRYVVDHMQRSAIRMRNLNTKKLTKSEQETSVIHAIFGGVLQSQVHCQKCLYESDTFDPFLDLSLDIKGCHSVERALQRFCRKEILDASNQYRCDRCKKLSQAHKQFTIFSAPNVAVLHLKRFSHSGMKINKFIEFPETLTLNSYMSRRSLKDSETYQYNLYAVLVHMGGSVHSGHYYCFVKSPSGSWYEMNDESVRQVSFKTVLKQQAYILFYCRTPVVSKTPTPTKPKRASMPDSAMEIDSLLKKRKRANSDAPVLESPEPKKHKNGAIDELSTMAALVEKKKAWKDTSDESKNQKKPSEKKEEKKKVPGVNPEAIVKKWDEKVKTLQKNGAQSPKIEKWKSPAKTFLTTSSLYDQNVGAWEEVETTAKSRKKILQSVNKEIKSRFPKKRDAYDREYDEGKQKKERTKNGSIFELPPEKRINPFQQPQNIPRSCKKRRTKKRTSTVSKFGKKGFPGH